MKDYTDTHNTFFSVVIPVYNQEKYIKMTIESVLNQSYQNFEIVVVDDGSSDETANIIKSLSETDNRIKIIRKENGGVASARNYGVLKADANWICFLDSDDLWYPEKLRKCYETIIEDTNNLNVICHDEKLMLEDGEIVDERRYGSDQYDLYEHLLFVGNCLSPSAVVVKKQFFDETGLFNESKYFNTVEDYDMWIRMAEKTNVYFLHSFLGAYRMHPGGISANYRVNYLNTIIVMIHNLLRYKKIKNVNSYRFYFESRKVLVKTMYKLAKMSRKRDLYTTCVLLFEIFLFFLRPISHVLRYNKIVMS